MGRTQNFPRYFPVDDGQTVRVDTMNYREIAAFTKRVAVRGRFSCSDDNLMLSLLQLPVSPTNPDTTSESNTNPSTSTNLNPFNPIIQPTNKSKALAFAVISIYPQGCKCSYTQTLYPEFTVELSWLQTNDGYEKQGLASKLLLTLRQYWDELLGPQHFHLFMLSLHQHTNFYIRRGAYPVITQMENILCYQANSYMAIPFASLDRPYHDQVIAWSRSQFNWRKIEIWKLLFDPKLTWLMFNLVFGRLGRTSKAITSSTSSTHQHSIHSTPRTTESSAYLYSLMIRQGAAEQQRIWIRNNRRMLPINFLILVDGLLHESGSDLDDEDSDDDVVDDDIEDEDAEEIEEPADLLVVVDGVSNDDTGHLEIFHME